MKRKSFVAVGLLLMAVGMSFFVYSRHHAAESRNPLAMANVEALTKDEFPAGWCKNFKSSTVWYIEGSSFSTGVSLVEPGILAQLTQNWVSMVCCLMGTDMDACNMQCENDECARRVERPACN